MSESESSKPGREIPAELYGSRCASALSIPSRQQTIAVIEAKQRQAKKKAPLQRVTKKAAGQKAARKPAGGKTWSAR